MINPVLAYYQIRLMDYLCETSEDDDVFSVYYDYLTNLISYIKDLKFKDFFIKDVLYDGDMIIGFNTMRPDEYVKLKDIMKVKIC